MEILAIEHDLTDAQARAALDYFNQAQSGASGRLTTTRVDRTLKSLTGSEGLSNMPGFYDDLQNSLESGKPISENDLRQAVSDLLQNAPPGFWSRNSGAGQSGDDNTLEPDTGILVAEIT